MTSPSIEPICTRDQLFSDGHADLNNINDESTESAKNSKKRKLNLKPVARITRSKAKASNVPHKACKSSLIF